MNVFSNIFFFQLLNYIEDFKYNQIFLNNNKISINKIKTIHDYLENAKNGDAISQYLLGFCYYYGKGSEIDKNKAHYWFMQSATQGIAEANYMLGKMYYLGDAVTKDIWESIKHYKIAARKGLSEAQCQLGYLYYYDKEIKNFDESFQWLSKASSNGNANAKYALGYIYFYNHKIEEAMSYFQESLSLPSSSCALATCYEIKKDYEKASIYYREAILGNDGLAMVKLGHLYEERLGIVRSSKNAVALYKQAALNSLPAAQMYLSFLYAYGKLVKKDKKEAQKWWTFVMNSDDELVNSILNKLNKFGI